jgi:hypothetical protein
MNRMENNLGREQRLNRVRRWPVFGLLLVFAWSRALAQDTYYENDGIVTYPGNMTSAPQIDALNFINNGTFVINFPQVISFGIQPFFQTSDTINYTNTGVMMVNTGFKFDTLSSVSGLETMAGNFDNQGSIYCASVQDLTDPYLGFFAQYGYAQCLVSATNIASPGLVEAGIYGLIQFSGQNVNLTQTTLAIESTGTNAANDTGTGFFGLNTNIWDPAIDLGSNYALTPIFPIAPVQLFLTNSSAYVNIAPVDQFDNIIRTVFIQDGSGPSVGVSVYFDTGNLGFGGGNVTIQWAGTYLDPASGNIYTNFLYLNDDYELGASTNVQPVIGIPINFVFSQYASPQLPNASPTPPSAIIGLFPDVDITNFYDVFNAQFSSSYSTNSIANQSITNLPGRVEISAVSNLDLTLAQITGINYLSLEATNQFNGSAGAFIQTPYADLNLGNTNPTFYVTNVMEGTIATFGGQVIGWNTRFLLTVVDPVSGNTITNDYRVLVVSSHLTPTQSAQVQNLNLHNTNSLVISDTFNVMNSFRSDAQSLTLSTNPPGNGATSLDGELNLNSTGISLQTSTPNLHFLTNNGAIRMQNLAYFGHPFITNVTPAVAASGLLSKSATGTNLVQKDIVTVGTNQYTFVTVLTNSLANQIAIVPGSLDGSLGNLIAAINGSAGAGTAYSSATRSNAVAAAGTLTNHAFGLAALVAGAAGNSIVTTFSPATKSTNLTWSGQSALAGGSNPVTNDVSFLSDSALINDGIFQALGSTVYAGNFVNGGVFSSSSGSCSLQALTATLTNGLLYAGSDISITASNLVTSNVVVQAGRSLTLVVTNLLTDTGLTNNNSWYVGAASIGSGINLPVKPASGDLLGTTITLSAPTNYTVVNVWAGTDQGVSPSGYHNNVAVGELIMNAASSSIPGRNGVLTFNGAGMSNALYVDLLVLTNFSTQGNSTNSYNFPWLKINTNMMIYFAQATENGKSVAEAIDNVSRNGGNGGRLRWVYSYAGYLSSTNVLYTNLDGSITTNAVNAALAQSSTIDSDSDGLPNNVDPTPFFVPVEIKFNLTLAANLSQNMARLQWTTIPNATNAIWYTTNLLSTNWLALTNFSNWYYGNNVAVTNAAHLNSFHSPQVYVNNASLPDNSQQTNVWVFDAITNAPRYYKVVVSPWLNFPE